MASIEQMASPTGNKHGTTSTTTDAALLSPGSKLASAGIYFANGKPPSPIKSHPHSMITGLTKAVPSKVGPQDGTWVRRAEQDEVYDVERRTMYSALKEHHLTRVEDQGNDKVAARAKEEARFQEKQKALKQEARAEAARLKGIRQLELTAKANEVQRVREKDVEVERAMIEETHKDMATMWERIFGDGATEVLVHNHQMDQKAMWAKARLEERQDKERVEERKKQEREQADMEMRATKKALDGKAAKAEVDLARKIKAEMKAETKAQADKAAAKADIRYKKSVDGRKANLEYQQTHHDRLQWSAPPTVGQMDMDGDGVLSGDEVIKNRTRGGFSSKEGAL